MQTNLGAIKQNLLGFLLLGLIGWAAYGLFKLILAFFTELNPSVAAAIVAASATVLVSVFSVLTSKSLEQKAIIAQQIREKKIPVYEELIQFVFNIIRATKENKSLSEEETTEFMFTFTERIVVWGSDEVVDAFYRFRNSNNVDGGQGAILCIEDMLLAIRKDLGHRNKSLSRGKILGLFINDIENITLVKK